MSTKAGKPTNAKPKRWTWKRIGIWTFWIVNILCVIIALPLLMSIWPLVKAYWLTRSVSAVESNETFQTNQSSVPSLLANAEEELATLNQSMEKIAHLEPEEYDRMVEQYFGDRPAPPENADEFDDDSAVFESIDKIIREVEGVRYHIYFLHMKDANGNRETVQAAFEKPDPEYERSMMVMKTVQENPQLRYIYDSASHLFAKWSVEEEATASEEAPEEAIDLEVLEELISEPENLSSETLQP